MEKKINEGVVNAIKYLYENCECVFLKVHKYGKDILLIRITECEQSISEVFWYVDALLDFFGTRIRNVETCRGDYEVDIDIYTTIPYESFKDVHNSIVEGDKRLD